MRRCCKNWTAASVDENSTQVVDEIRRRRAQLGFRAKSGWGDGRHMSGRWGGANVVHSGGGHDVGIQLCDKIFISMTRRAAATTTTTTTTRPRPTQLLVACTAALSPPPSRRIIQRRRCCCRCVWRGGAMVGRRTGDQEVASSIPGQGAAV